MKKQIKINYILTLILVFCIGTTIPTLIGSSQVNEQHSALLRHFAHRTRPGYL